jgi:hypothetical protein
MKSESDVREYYEHNTRRFLRFGQGHQAAAIHRAIRHPDAEDPFRYQEQLILELLERFDITGVVDLGCGVGSSLVWLSEHREARYRGITLSPLQAAIAKEMSRGKDIEIITGSYMDRRSYPAPGEESGPRLFFGIESFLHCSEPSGFFKILKQQTASGDLLVIWDDFLTSDVRTGPAGRTLEAFQEGWHALNLLTPQQADLLAGENGFVLIDDRNLTPYLEIDRVRDYLISVMVPVLKPFNLNTSWWQNLLGGNALRKSLKSGWLSYRFRVWTRE